MPFLFLKYVQPTWYFNLKPGKGKIPYWANFKNLPPSQQELIEFDNSYQSEEARLLDASFQAWHKGIIDIDASADLDALTFQPKVTIKDNYRFI
nr:glycosyltransferase family 2 protein [Bacteroidota bacterium]